MPLYVLKQVDMKGLRPRIYLAEGENNSATLSVRLIMFDGVVHLVAEGSGFHTRTERKPFSMGGFLERCRGTDESNIFNVSKRIQFAQQASG